MRNANRPNLPLVNTLRIPIRGYERLFDIGVFASYGVTNPYKGL